MQRIPVMDDTELNRELLRNMLEEDYIVEMAEDGEQALEKPQEYQGETAALLLDLQMPKKDGFTVAEEMKKKDRIIRIQAEKLRDAKSFHRLMTEYRTAIMEVETRLKALNAEFSQEYNRNPFESILSVPIFLSDGKKDVKGEVQFRTIAMDFWASLEHKLKYKRDVDDTDEIVGQLRVCGGFHRGVGLSDAGDSK